MPNDLDELRRDIGVVVSSLKLNISQMDNIQISRQLASRIDHLFDQILVISGNKVVSDVDGPTPAYWNTETHRRRRLDNARRIIEEIIQLPEAERFLRETPIGPALHSGIVQSTFVHAIGNELSIDHGLRQLARQIRDTIEPMDQDYDVYTDEDIDDALNSAPPQRLGPVTFDISNEKFFLGHKKSTPANEQHAESALRGLIRAGRSLIEDLTSSNYDKYLLKCALDVQSTLEDDANIIQLGMLNNLLSDLIAASKAEFSNSFLAVIQSHHNNISLYIAQFPDWRDYSAEVALTNIHAEDLPLIEEAGARFLEGLSTGGDYVDPRAPAAIAPIQKSLERSSGESKKAAAVGTLVTIGNYASAIFLWLGKKTADVSATEFTKWALKTLSDALPPLQTLIALGYKWIHHIISML
jgi:hypothetical protein